ncbi:MAG: hypothetical protein AAF211_33685, partial [Myxococcota bacterium]
MRAGDRLGGRWRLNEELSTTNGVVRYAAIDDQSGARVDVWTLTAARADADARRAFLDVHEAMAAVHGGSGVLETGTTDDVAWVARGPFGVATVAEVDGPVTPAQVAALGAKMVPEILAAGAATRGTLLGSDIALDSDGRPQLAPTGAPLNAVVRGSSRAVAPEVVAGHAPTGASGLFGLGVTLYRLATGSLPELDAAGTPPAPPSATRPDSPAVLDEAILTLLSIDPDARATALEGLQEVAGDEVPRLEVRTRSVVGEV